MMYTLMFCTFHGYINVLLESDVHLLPILDTKVTGNLARQTFFFCADICWNFWSFKIRSQSNGLNLAENIDKCVIIDKNDTCRPMFFQKNILIKWVSYTFFWITS